MSTYPQVGQILRMNLVTLQEEKAKLVYKTRVSDITGDLLAIEVPIEEESGRGYRIPEGMEVSIWFMGEDGSRYDFRSTISGYRTDNIPVLLLKLPPVQEITRTQRRNYLRVDVQLEISVKTTDTVRNYHFLARTSDISGGGLSFTCSDQYRLKEHDPLMLWLVIPLKNGTIMHAQAEGEVTRIKKLEDVPNMQWVSVKFVNIHESDQAKVVRACYERQLELRKKGITE
ncbi:flagellar brake protein [Brevibacillus fluminis]|uniref:flagellar brake protein n=1 Tax=Brevibacillus fluminis TaxID=511487 RepID=UPI001FE34705|nr:flagellar brake domain-containing protein [Brevibacillus fluminis]